MRVIYRVDKLTGETVVFLPDKRVTYIGNIKCYSLKGEREETLRYYVVGTKPATGVDLTVMHRMISEMYGTVEETEILTNEMKEHLLDDLCEVKYPQNYM